MIYCLLLAVCFILIILQTTILPGLAAEAKCYDLSVAFVIALGLLRTPREAIPLVLISGWLMDNLSGGPFGLYLTVYICLYISVTLGIRFLHKTNLLLLILIVPAGVGLENLVRIAIGRLQENGFPLLPALSTMGAQMLWALVAGPPLLWLLICLNAKWDKWYAQQAAQRRDPHGH